MLTLPPTAPVSPDTGSLRAQPRREVDAGSVHDALGGATGSTLPPAYDDVPLRWQLGHTAMSSSTALGGTAAVAGGGSADPEGQGHSVPMPRPAKSG